MKKWAVVVVILYGLSLVMLTLPFTIGAFWDFTKNSSPWTAGELKSMFTVWPYWLGIALFILAQAALLVIPVGVSQSRPASRRPVWLPVITSALMMALMICGLFIAIYETVRGEKFTNENAWLWISLVILLISWVVWGIIFRKWSMKAAPGNFLERTCRCLFYGSILELLVAVPTHIVARYRNYCCAGYGTFFGITFGIAIMLLSFGPGIFFLFAERWKQLHPVEVQL